MERLKNITIIFLLAVGLLNSIAPPICFANRSSGAKPASVLLQEGLYAEEIEGDLDAAIKIYEQVIAEAKETQRAAAQATYRIGMCYLKKGEKAKAAQQFREFISKFPKQQALGTRAREQLAKLKPIGGFGLVIERTVMDRGSYPQTNCCIDFESGQMFGMPPSPLHNYEDYLRWFASKGIDAIGEADEEPAFLVGLSGVEIATLSAKNQWDTIRPEDIRRKLALSKPTTPAKMVVECKAPAEYIFRTREGGMGILQILEVKVNSHTRIRYKMLQEPGTVRPTFDFGPEVERIIYTDETGKDCFFDLDTGKAFSIPQGLTRSSDPEKGIPWILENGIDFVNCVGRLQLWDMVAVEVEEKIWDSEDAVEINSVLMRDPSKEFLPTEQEEYIITAPFIYAFETREGGIGLLQILEKRNTYLKIRYKMLQEPAKIAPVEVFGPVIKRVIYQGGSEYECLIDFESGKLFKVPEGLKDSRGKESEVLKWVKETGVDAAGDTEGPITSQGLQGFVNDLVARPAVDGWNTTPRELVATMGSLLPEPHGKARMFGKGALPATYFFKTRDGGMGVLQILGFTVGDPRGVKIRYKMLQKEKAKSPIDLSTPEATIKSFVKAVYNGNLEAAKACVSKDGADYDEFMEMLATESNHPFQAMIRAMDTSIPVEITSKDITEDRCKIKWYFTLGRVYYIGDTKIKKGTHQKFGSYLELVGDKWLIRDI